MQPASARQARSATIIATGPPRKERRLCPEEKHRHETCVRVYGPFACSKPCVAQPNPPGSPPATATVTIAGKTITINYSSPRVNGREGHIFNKDGLIEQTHKSYPVWRAGANAATALHTDADLTIGDLNVPAGNYTLFVDIANPASGS